MAVLVKLLIVPQLLWSQQDEVTKQKSYEAQPIKVITQLSNYIILV